MTRVRIAVFCPGYGAIGGIERKAESLVREFQRRGHEVVILARGPDAASRPDADPPVVRRRFHGVPRRWWPPGRQLRFALGLPSARARLGQAVAAHRPDVVLTLTVSTFAPYAIGLARTAPLVLSLEGREQGGVFTATPRVLRAALRRATRVVACSTSLAASARALAPDVTSRLTVIVNGVDLERFGDGAVFAHPRPYVLAVGRLARQKGFDVLLEAVARLPPGVDLLVAGDGPERALLEAERARLGLTDRVHFLGPVDQNTVATLYRGALLVACPSRWEGMPLVCLEAMASGCAVVAAAVDGVPDAVADGETGVLVPPEDPAALAAVLGALLADSPRRRRLGEEGRARAGARFAWPEIAARYLDVLAAAAR